MLAVSFARQDREAAGAVLSDALGIACVLGCALAVLLYAGAPAALSAIAGEASREVIAPALSYVRIRCFTPRIPRVSGRHVYFTRRKAVSGHVERPSRVRFVLVVSCVF